MEARQAIAASLIESGIQSCAFDLNIALLRICESDLLGPDHILKTELSILADEAEKVLSRAASTFPKSVFQVGKTHLAPKNLLQEVDLYRQEIFWTASDTALRVKAEEVIRDLFRLYRKAESLMCNIDDCQPDYRDDRRVRAPEWVRNPYEEIVSPVGL
ncbi:MAG: hypothetical protein KIT44_09385 [Opitutaceae bacterium]|nr:hypothetical protein [Opitutaceae bacterium]